MRPKLSSSVLRTTLFVKIIVVMCFNDKVSRFAHRIVARCRRKRKFVEVSTECQPLLSQSKLENGNVSTSEEILESDLTLKDIDELGKFFLLKKCRFCLKNFVFVRGIQGNMEMARRNVESGKVPLGDHMADFVCSVYDNSRL